MSVSENVAVAARGGLLVLRLGFACPVFCFVVHRSSERTRPLSCSRDSLGDHLSCVWRDEIAKALRGYLLSFGASWPLNGAC